MDNPNHLKIGDRVRCNDPDLIWYNQIGIVTNIVNDLIYVKFDDQEELLSAQSLVKINQPPLFNDQDKKKLSVINKNNQHDWFCVWADWQLSKEKSILHSLYYNNP